MYLKRQMDPLRQIFANPGLIEVGQLSAAARTCLYGKAELVSKFLQLSEYDSLFLRNLARYVPSQCQYDIVESVRVEIAENEKNWTLLEYGCDPLLLKLPARVGNRENNVGRRLDGSASYLIGTLGKIVRLPKDYAEAYTKCFSILNVWAEVGKNVSLADEDEDIEIAEGPSPDHVTRNFGLFDIPHREYLKELHYTERYDMYNELVVILGDLYYREWHHYFFGRDISEDARRINPQDFPATMASAQHLMSENTLASVKLRFPNSGDLPSTSAERKGITSIGKF
jgi:hypothetical protein